LQGANRELDSSITIKSIVSHLFHFNLSQRQRDDPSSKLQRYRLTHETRRTKQASKEQQEPIDEGTKNSTSLTNHSLTHASLFMMTILASGSLALYWYWYWRESLIDISANHSIGVCGGVLDDEHGDEEEGTG